MNVRRKDSYEFEKCARLINNVIINNNLENFK